MPAGSFANASSVGANTVNGPSPLRRLDEAGGLHGGEQRGEAAGADGRVDDVGLLGHGRRGGGQRERGAGGEERGADHVSVSNDCLVERRSFDVGQPTVAASGSDH